ncbi:hypothetical protein CDG77_11090 [Nostoc sp. 'Peltigera membranacea cyanobiont' 213]|uniref:hypothetical protein n=1 Tax=Nostoc sp. 'Peltigera membranacea cyanobiont' 213 TaxID=2014530 RepID=UPI000B951015|nr:hypothetical protein [Nostoc sp. 'Peltigera membranacea cyanobiont' 213]OYD95037.1 hypothetical protein CDG77_11090 [Nostoc sp. 'Peltigera membranacea cyanobiont' 213]
MDAIAKIAVEVVGILSIMKRICNMVNIFTITSFSAFVFASTTTLLLVQTVTAKPVQIKKQVNQAKPLNSGVRIYPANNSLPASRLITIERAIKKSSNMQITEAKLTTYEEFAAQTGMYKSSISNNRMVWIITGFVQGEFRMSKGRSVCTDNAKLVELIDAETGDSFGRSVHCPLNNQINFMP